MNTATTIQPRSMNFMFFASLVTLACIMSSGRADAQSAQVLTKTVRYDVRSLSTESGARILYTRVRSAAREVCTPFESRELSRRSIWQSCVDNAVASAVLKINSPLVSALHNQSSGRGGAS